MPTIAAGMKSSGRTNLVANTATPFTFAENIGQAQVTSDGTAAVYVTFDGTTPTVDGANSYEIPAGPVGILTRPTVNSGANSLDVVILISAGTPSVRVERAD